MKTVSILGCGWLGLSLAQVLVELGFIVKGSTTTRSKFSALEIEGVMPFFLDLNTRCALDHSFFDSDILIVTLPFRRSEPAKSYLSQISKLLPFIRNSTIQRIVFTSSTAIYPDSNDWVTEDSVLPLETERQQILFEVESLLLQAAQSSWILRLAGLIGPNRVPLSFLGKAKSRHPYAPVNMVQRKDVVTAIIKSFELQDSGILNICADDHPTRSVYYKTLYERHNPGKQLNLTDFFENTEPLKFKKVANQKSKELLGITYSGIYL